MRQNVGNTQVPQLVFFKDAVEHILRAARVFRQPGGHMLMVSKQPVLLLPDRRYLIGSGERGSVFHLTSFSRHPCTLEGNAVFRPF